MLATRRACFMHTIISVERTSTVVPFVHSVCRLVLSVSPYPNARWQLVKNTRGDILTQNTCEQFTISPNFLGSSKQMPQVRALAFVSPVAVAELFCGRAEFGSVVDTIGDVS